MMFPFPPRRSSQSKLAGSVGSIFACHHEGRRSSRSSSPQAVFFPFFPFSAPRSLLRCGLASSPELRPDRCPWLRTYTHCWPCVHFFLVLPFLPVVPRHQVVSEMPAVALFRRTARIADHHLALSGSITLLARGFILGLRPRPWPRASYSASCYFFHPFFFR